MMRQWRSWSKWARDSADVRVAAGGERCTAEWFSPVPILKPKVKEV